MAIPGLGLGIFRFEYSGEGLVVADRVEFMAVPVPGLGIPGVAEIRGVLFEYSGSDVVAGNGVQGMAILSPGLGLYLSLSMLLAAVASSSWQSPSTASGSLASPRSGVDHGRRMRLGHGDCRTCPGDCPVRVQW